MKKNYRKPLIQKIEFEYGDNVVAASTESCDMGITKAVTEPQAGCAWCFDEIMWYGKI